MRPRKDLFVASSGGTWRSRRVSRSGILFGSLTTVVASLGATATFTPVGQTVVTPGTPVVFNVSVAAQTLSGFDAADIVIGSNAASDLSFAYSLAWQAAFNRVTPPTPLGLYAQDVFVGGNNPLSVGQSMALGTLTVHTVGLVEGTYDVRVDANLRPDLSSLVLAGVHEDLSGIGTFTIACAAADPQCDNDVDLNDYQLLHPCITGPEQVPQNRCLRYDMDGDADVDFGDLADFFAQFTGAN